MTTGKLFAVTGMLSLFCMTAVSAGQAKPSAGAPNAAAALGWPAGTQKPAAAAKASPGSIANGETLYKRSCQMCHGPAGLGDGPAAKTLKGKLPSLADKAEMSEHSDAELHKLITEGQKTEIGNMPGMGKKFKPEEITDIVNYVRMLAK